MNVTTVLDVIDNFLTSRGDEDFSRMPGRALVELGQEVQRFTSSYSPPAAASNMHPIYIGGWPSANFWSALSGPLIMSSLLYSGQVLVKDPISDWFSIEQYSARHLESAREGFIAEDGSFNALNTRAFLEAVVPQLRSMRPLIQTGAIALAPFHKFHAENMNEIEALRDSLSQRPNLHPSRITQRFAPSDLTVDDNRRGSFVFAGGEAESQLQRAVGHALEYYAREWSFATHYGAEYAAPFSFEQYVSSQGLEATLLESGSQKVIHALWISELPIFQGLTPAVVASIRDNDTFAEFRHELFQAYRDLPTSASDSDLAHYVAENEQATLRPIIDSAKKEADRGALRRIGVQVTAAGFALASSVVGDSITGDVGSKTLLHAGARYALDCLFGKNKVGKRSAWAKLYKHSSSYESEISRVKVQPATDNSTPPWHIPDEPSMSVTVTTGAFLIELPSPARQDPNGYQEGVYARCNCGSGRKYKFCCQGTPRYRIRRV